MDDEDNNDCYNGSNEKMEQYDNQFDVLKLRICTTILYSTIKMKVLTIQINFNSCPDANDNATEYKILVIQYQLHNTKRNE